MSIRFTYHLLKLGNTDLSDHVSDNDEHIKYLAGIYIHNERPLIQHIN